jgi:hypothetical protein
MYASITVKSLPQLLTLMIKKILESVFFFKHHHAKEFVWMSISYLHVQRHKRYSREIFLCGMKIYFVEDVGDRLNFYVFLRAEKS